MSELSGSKLPLLALSIIALSATISQTCAAGEETMTALEQKLFAPVLSDERLQQLLNDLLKPQARGAAQRRWQEVRDIAEEIERKCPLMSEYIHKDVAAGLRYSRTQLSTGAGAN